MKLLNPIRGLIEFVHYVRAYRTCWKLKIPKEVCYLQFGTLENDIKERAEYRPTQREERVFIDYDDEGRILGIELRADYKPCQKYEGAHKRTFG